MPVAEIGHGEEQAEIGQRQGQDGGFRQHACAFLPRSLNPFDGAATSAPTHLIQIQPEPPMAAYQYIYVMKGLNKTFPGGKQVLKDIWLSFLPGAKIGVLGLNGAGKSTLLKLMAGQDDNFTGEAWAAEGAKVGMLEQEPKLDAKKDVLGNVMDGAGEMAQMLARFEEVSNAFSDPDADMDKLIAEQAELQEKIDAGNGWDLGRTVEIAMDALRCPPGDADVEKLSGGERRRVALCRLLLSKPDMLLLDEPTNHLDAEFGGLAGAPSRRVPRHRRGRHPRSLLPRQCRGLDPRARPRRRHPVGGQLHLLAEAEGQAARARREDRRCPPPHHAARARMDGPERPGAAHQEQGAHRGLRADGGRGEAGDARPGADRHPGRPAAGRPCHHGREDLQGLRRPAA